MTDRDTHKGSKVRRLRAGAQMVCISLFVYLALAARSQWKAPLPYDLFLRFDPLVWAMASVASREAALYGSFALALIAATVLFGRVFCGWVCPLGTVLDVAHLVRGQKPSGSLVERLSSVRYWVLIALVGAAVAGVNFVKWLDPLVMGSRALHVERGARLDWVAVAVGWAIVGVVISLTFFALRFWCRTLCPPRYGSIVGGALGSISSASRQAMHGVRHVLFGLSDGTIPNQELSRRVHWLSKV